MAGKPRAKKDKGEAAPQGENVSPGVGHNDLTDDQKRALFCQGIVKIERLKEKQASIVSDIRNERKRMKSDGFSPKQIDYALFLRSVETEEAVELRKLQAEVARWLAHPVGHQAELFGDGIDRTPAVDLAFEEGKTAGMSGQNCELPQKWAPGSPQGQKWLDGWHAGQSALMSGFKPLAENEAEGDDEFDDETSGHPSRQRPKLDGGDAASTAAIQ